MIITSLLQTSHSLLLCVRDEGNHDDWTVDSGSGLVLVIVLMVVLLYLTTLAPFLVLVKHHTNSMSPAERISWVYIRWLLVLDNSIIFSLSSNFRKLLAIKFNLFEQHV